MRTEARGGYWEGGRADGGKEDSLVGALVQLAKTLPKEPVPLHLLKREGMRAGGLEAPPCGQIVEKVGGGHEPAGLRAEPTN